MIAKIQYITQDHPALSHSAQAAMMFKKGIEWVQVRMKNVSSPTIIEETKQAIAHAQAFAGKIIVNDHWEIALQTGADGVHLGLKDTPIQEVRKCLGDKMIIGGTANTLDDVLLQIAAGADYVGLGPFRFTTTKKNLSPIVGLHGYETICRELQKRGIDTPIIAVGGITQKDIAPIQSTGIYGVAISSDLLQEIYK